MQHGSKTVLVLLELSYDRVELSSLGIKTVPHALLNRQKYLLQN